MAKNLQELRKEAGYKSAKDFAAAIDIPASTYSRYEAQPDSIPISAASKIADFLDTSIDVIVDRVDLDDNCARGEAQRFYDALSPKNRALLDEFMNFIAQREEAEREQMRKAEEKKYRELAEKYEVDFLKRLTAKDPFDSMRPLSKERTRLAFQNYVNQILERNRSDEMYGLLESEAMRIAEFYNADFTELDDSEYLPENVSPFYFTKPEEKVESCNEELAKFMFKASDQLKSRDEEVLKKIMAAYDQMHSKDGSRVEYWVTSI